MLTSGEVVSVDLGLPAGREAGFRHPVVVVTAQRLLDAAPSVVHVVPLTSSLRGFASEVQIEAGALTGLRHTSSAQCQHLRAVSVDRLDMSARPSNIGIVALAQVREVIGLILDTPG